MRDELKLPIFATERKPDELPPGMEPFTALLEQQGLRLTRSRTTVLQVNTGLLCNQTCLHCHLEASPSRTEVMDERTGAEVVEFAGRHRFQVIDITGGAPEMNPHLGGLIECLAPLTPRTMLRSNLTAIGDASRRHLIDLCRRLGVVIVASLPSLNKAQTDSQRGENVFDKSIETLRWLNSLGYGRPGSNLELDLVSNAAGAFLPAPQDQAEKRFRRDLETKWKITFNHLFAFANAPLGRYRQWLIKSGNYANYMRKLASSFNPCTLPGLMCRTLMSVGWDGCLYDCDFNQAAGLFMGGRKTHISSLEEFPELGSPVCLGNHCYACTAGTGFT
jgi:radical SAM/Cys-rich protein